VAVDRHRRPADDAVDGRVARVRRHEDRRRRRAPKSPLPQTGRARRGDRPEAAVVADVDDLDPAIERVGERGGAAGDRPACVVARRADIVE
jgi:hypothetical protein